MLDASIVLRDGRELAYTDCGDPDGPLVMYFHGAPSSRLDLVAWDDEFASVGVRLVTPDRPGYGKSSVLEPRAYSDWPGDVAARADQLGRDRFAVMGLSSGGPYALACGSMIPDRVVGLGVVAGVTDMSWPPAWEGYPEREATIMRLEDPEAAMRWCEENVGADGAKILQEAPELADADWELLSNPDVANALFLSASEAFRQGVRAYAQDITLESQPWPFNLASITAPVRVLHGEADTFLRVAHAEHTSALIPGSFLEIFPNHGHVSIMIETPQLANSLVVSLR